MSPRAFGKYVVVEVIGRGGMADVYRARHPTLARDVAIKAIHPHLAAEPGFQERFVHEARLVAALRHPSIVQVYDFDTSAGRPYMVMEFVDGGTLKERLARVRAERGPMTLAEASAFLGPIADALDYAHAHGAVHRDLKPANVLLTAAGDPVLSDFGIAKILEDSIQVSATGALVGTPAYMSPEQAGSRPVDARSDQYSLGVLAYEMVTGRVPFQGESPTAVMVQHLQDPPPEPRTFNPAVPEAVQAVILRSLAKDPEARFPSAGTFAREFATAVAAAARADAAVAPTLVPGGAGLATTIVPGPAAAAVAPTLVPGVAPTLVPGAAPWTPSAVPLQVPAIPPGAGLGPPAPPSPAATPSPADRRPRRALPWLVVAALVLALAIGGGGLAISQGWLGGTGGPSASPAGSAGAAGQIASPVGPPGGSGGPIAVASGSLLPSGGAAATPAPPPASTAPPPPAASPTPVTSPPASTPTPRPTAGAIAAAVGKCPSTSGTLLDQDDFSQRTSGWPINTEGPVRSRYEDGAYHVTVLDPDHWWAASYEPSGMDATYGVQLRAWPTGTPGDGTWGIYFGVIDKFNMFELTVRSSGEFRLAKAVDNEEIDLIPWTSSGRLRVGSPNVLAVAVRGKVVTVCLNGSAVAAVKEPDMRVGRVGMVAWSDTPDLDVWYDDFTVWDLK